MKDYVERRNFLKSVVVSPALIASGILSGTPPSQASYNKRSETGSKLKTSLNAYSFNEPLKNGSMKLEDLLDFCAANNFDAVDLTGYYFPGYPNVPPDEYIFNLKRKAFLLGLDISGTGVRNDFTNPDAAKRKEDIILIKNWIECASKLGAPVIRIFSGTQNPPGYSWTQIKTWMVKDINECVEHGKTHGVIVAVQNHNDFIKTADEAQNIIESVNSAWFGLILDIGSYRRGDPFKQIEQNAKYAVNWQIKENLYVDGVEQKTDLKKVISIVKASGYRGYLPIETLGEGDPKIKVPRFLAEVRKAIERG
ncbi:MAG: Sugar phosphate isomerase/epimerase [Segetibacter sp.]|nr:Sugar phosphate isomerase/epimerase [Segetibacter sp.]